MRYFKITDPLLIALAQTEYQEEQIKRELVCNLLDMWGSRQVVPGYRDGLVVGIRDPRTFADNPHHPGRGWAKLKRFPDFVYPTNDITRNWFEQLQNLAFEKTIKEFCKALEGTSEQAKKSIEGSTEWMYYKDGKNYWGGPHCQCLQGRDFYFCLGDTTLAFHDLPGYLEIKEWEYLKARDEHNAKVKQEKALIND